MLAEKIDKTTKDPVDTNKELLKELWKYNRAISEILCESRSDDEARNSLYSYFWLLERGYDLKEDAVPSLEWDLGRQCLRVAKNLISRRAQRLTDFNCIALLRKLANPNVSNRTLRSVSRGFLVELERLWAGCRARSGIYWGQSTSGFMELDGRDAALFRAENLDLLSSWMETGMNRYPNGLQQDIVDLRAENRFRIQKVMGANDADWADWRWHLRHVIKSAEDLEKLIDLDNSEHKAIKASVKNHIPFGITPYYAHLMDEQPGGLRDMAIRRQVIPPIDYVEALSTGRRKIDDSFDFMQEKDTSPVDIITRRYPMICILKPYNTCSQICVYCQRNWEIEECLDPRAMASKKQLDEAFDYIASHATLKEVLVTGGDPLIMSNKKLKEILDRLADIPHVERIRLGTRTPVVLPMRINDETVNLLASYKKPGKRDVVMMTHFEHPYEVTPEAAEAVDRLLNHGITVSNQVVYTFANSRRFELAALRRVLRLIGVEPYYTFSAKGKEETNWYRVPLARIQQERKEEARLTPGTWRTDDTIFNVPRLGKNYLNRQQDHELITILPDGSRVYEFHPWEKKIALVDTYLHTDVPIYDYLQRISELGDDPEEYASIWYYF